MIRYPLKRIFEEVAYLAYYLHWPMDSILSLEHRDRQKWVEEVGRMNKEISEGSR